MFSVFSISTISLAKGEVFKADHSVVAVMSWAGAVHSEEESSTTAESVVDRFPGD